MHLHPSSQYEIRSPPPNQPNDTLQVCGFNVAVHGCDDERTIHYLTACCLYRTPHCIAPEHAPHAGGGLSGASGKSYAITQQQHDLY